MLKYLKSLFVGLLIAVGVTVYVLGARHSPPVAPAGYTVIQYWEKWTGEEAAGMQSIVDDFNRTVGREKHIYVQYVSMSSIDQKTMVAVAAGVPPDIAGLWDNQLNGFAALNALEPLDDLAKAHGIGPDTYKPIYWKACSSYENHLWGLISTPASIALHYNKQLFNGRAAELRAAGLDPDKTPTSIDALDRYSDALTTYITAPNGKDRRIKCSGFLPMEPGWYVNVMSYWFGGTIFDPKQGKLQLTSEPMIKTFEWLESYPKKYGKDALTQFHSGTGNFDSAQNPFFTGDIAMVQQGPWMANYIEHLAPSMNRWHVPAEKQKREKDFDHVTIGMSHADVTAMLGAGTALPNDPQMFSYDAGIKTIYVTFDAGDHVVDKRMDYLPALERRKYTEWGAAAFPSATGEQDVSYCPFDVLVIPRGSKHKEEAFEFLAFVTRQDEMEKLCALHCKNSPLAKVSEHFVKYHPNPYIDVFERLANSPNAKAVPAIPVWPQVSDELTVASQKASLLVDTPQAILEEADHRCEKSWNYFQHVHQLREQQATEAAQ
ncbi:MAG: extracellular solute-binding protein [Tepidisphaeraceae bacterium]